MKDKRDFKIIIWKPWFRLGWYGNYEDSVGGGIATEARWDTGKPGFWRLTRNGIEKKMAKCEARARARWEK